MYKVIKSFVLNDKIYMPGDKVALTAEELKQFYDKVVKIKYLYK